MSREFTPVLWDEWLESDLRQLICKGFSEDLGSGSDWTSIALVSADATATAVVVARQAGTVAGLRAGEFLVRERKYDVQWLPVIADGTSVSAGDILARLSGSAREMLELERTLLNILGHLCGIATLTAKYVQQVAGTNARVFDTRKTLPGWRRLQKYAVRCGGGHNHRLGLNDAVLIKDNHLCQMQTVGQASAAEAVRQARDALSQAPASNWPMVLEIELDVVDELPLVLAERPDVVLLDNFNMDDLRRAVVIRNETAPNVQLEASGGVRLDTIAAIAATGVDRISVGAITHSAPNFDVALDWNKPV